MSSISCGTVDYSNYTTYTIAAFIFRSRMAKWRVTKIGESRGKSGEISTPAFRNSPVKGDFH